MGSLKRFDTEEVNAFVFHPQKYISSQSDIKRLSIEVDEEVQIGASFFKAKKDSPFILYFHGNDEIVSDYDDLGPIFVENNINFMPVDYRGYGFSDGTPSLVNMIEDAKKISEFTINFRKENNFTGPFAVMGRSLGSASAIELASSSDIFDALIIESGFSDFLYLLNTLGFYDPEFSGLEDPFSHTGKIKNFRKPLLIIHGENDEIIPFREGRELFNACKSKKKKLVKIEGAGHNTIFMHGMDEYFKEIKELLLNPL